MEDFYKQVKIELIKRGETIRYMSFRLGLNYNYLYQVLKGQRNSEDYVAKVKEYLGIREQGSGIRAK